MYRKTIPFTNFLGKPRNVEVQFNLTEREVFKLLVEFKAVFAWQDSIQGSPRELSTEEVVEFYNNFEQILLAAYGEVTPDGDHFDKSGRYKFEDSALFAECMKIYVTEPEETGKLIDGLMPKGMEELVRKADENVAKLDASGNLPQASEAELERQLAALRAQNSESAKASEV